MVPQHKVTGRLDQSWHLSEPGPSMLSNGFKCESAVRTSTDTALGGPARGPVGRETGSHTRGDSLTSSLKSLSRPEPILSSKKESTTKDGIPRTEYVWRHPPVFETVTGETQPVYIGAGLGVFRGDDHYSNGDDEPDATKLFTKGEEEILFRDSGYGAGGTLPGAEDMNPSSIRNGGDFGRVLDEPPKGTSNAASNTDREATKTLRRTKDRRIGSNAHETDQLQTEVRNLRIQ